MSFSIYLRSCSSKVINASFYKEKIDKVPLNPNFTMIGNFAFILRGDVFLMQMSQKNRCIFFKQKTVMPQLYLFRLSQKAAWNANLQTEPFRLFDFWISPSPMKNSKTHIWYLFDMLGSKWAIHIYGGGKSQIRGPCPIEGERYRTTEDAEMKRPNKLKLLYPILL